MEACEPEMSAELQIKSLLVVTKMFDIFWTGNKLKISHRNTK